MRRLTALLLCAAMLGAVHSARAQTLDSLMDQRAPVRILLNDWMPGWQLGRFASTSFMRTGSRLVTCRSVAFGTGDSLQSLTVGPFDSLEVWVGGGEPDTTTSRGWLAFPKAELLRIGRTCNLPEYRPGLDGPPRPNGQDIGLSPKS